MEIKAAFLPGLRRMREFHREEENKNGGMCGGQEENKLSLDKLCFVKSFIHKIFMRQFITDFVLYTGNTIKNKTMRSRPQDNYSLW